MYRHNTYTYCSSANNLNYDVKKAYEKLVQEFQEGNVTYPRTDSFNHLPITILNEQRINPEVKRILNSYPLFREDEEFWEGDVYSLAGVLNLSSPASLVHDVEEANILFSDEKIDEKDVNLFIGLQRKNFIEEEALFISSREANMNTFVNLFNNFQKEEYLENNLPAFDKNRYQSHYLEIA